MIEAAGWRLLPSGTDPVSAEVVFSVKLSIQQRGKRRGAACEVTAFEAATSARVAAAAELGRSADDEPGAVDQVCKPVADQLTEQLARFNQTVARRGLGTSLALRFSGSLRPDPKPLLATFLKEQGLSAHWQHSGPVGLRCLFTTTRSPKLVSETVEGLLQKHYRVRREPPSSLPGNQRILLFLIQPMK